MASQLASAQIERKLFVTNFSSDSNLHIKTGSCTECTQKESGDLTSEISGVCLNAQGSDAVPDPPQSHWSIPHFVNRLQEIQHL